MRRLRVSALQSSRERADDGSVVWRPTVDQPTPLQAASRVGGVPWAWVAGGAAGAVVAGGGVLALRGRRGGGRYRGGSAPQSWSTPAPKVEDAPVTMP